MSEENNVPEFGGGKFDGAAEAEFGKQMEKRMQEIMREYPGVMAKVMLAVQEHAKTSGGTSMPMGLMIKTLQKELPPEAWEKVIAPMTERDVNAPRVGEMAPDFNLPVMGTEEKVRLGDHIGKDAVAIIFGNYT